MTLYIDCEPTRTIKMRPKATGILVGGNTLVGSSNFNTDNQVGRLFRSLDLFVWSEFKIIF